MSQQMSTPAVAATRNTVQRALVLEAMQVLEGSHPTSADVYTQVSQVHPTISRATVYRNLNHLVEQGVLKRVEVSNGADCFELREDPHYHLKCESCGRLFDATLPYREELSHFLEDTQGFLVTGHTIVFTGICAECAARTAQSK